MKRRLRRATAAAAACLGGWTTQAQAQVAQYPVPGEQTADFAPLVLARSGLFARDEDIGVRQRARPELDVSGIPVAGFTLSPQFTAGLGYDDNVFALPQTESDAIIVLQPEAVIESDWSRNAVSAFARVTSLSYLDHDSESRVDYAFGANGRLDVARDLGLAAGASYERDTEPRTSPSSPIGAAEPERFDVAKAYLGGVKQFNRLRLSAEVDVRDLAYDNAPAVGGGVIYERDRSRTETGADAMAEYALTPSTSVFVDAAADHREFRDELPTNPSRTSSGYDLTAGANFEVTRLIVGQLQAGYLSQDYDDPRFKTVSGLSIRGVVRYFPTPLLTVSLTGGRAVEDAEVPGSSGYLASTAQLLVDYELLRQLIISAQLAYENDDFKGVDRTDDRPSASGSAEYRINRHVAVVLRYDYIRQRSTGALRGVDYDVNRFATSLAYRF